MTRSAVEYALFLLDRAFDGDEEHSLLANLRDVTPEDWLAKHPGGGRTIRAIVDHAGTAKYLYWNHLFADAMLTYQQALASSPSMAGRADIDGVKAWLREGHSRFRQGVASMDDAQLDEPAKTHWGAVMPRKQIIGIMVHHDVYHAGEINHLRAILQEDDAWPGQRDRIPRPEDET